MAVVFPLMIVACALAYWPGDVAKTTGPFHLGIGVIMLALYYAGMCRHIRQVVARESAAQPGTPADAPRPAGSGRG